MNRAVERYTFNPEADKALKEEHAVARDRMKELQSLSGQIREKSVGVQMASVTKQRLVALSDKINKWISSNTNASSEEIDNQISIGKDGLADILLKNAGNYFFEVVLVLSDQLAASVKDVTTRASLMSLIAKERVWFKANGDLSLDAYKARKSDFDKLVKGLNVEPVAVDDKPEVNVSAVEGQVNAPSLAPPAKSVNLTATFFQVLTWAFLFFLIMAGGAFGANMSFNRPVAFRILSFVYGCIFFPLILAYAAIMALSGKGVVMHSLCIPLFEAAEKSNYLRWFTYDPVGRAA